MEAACGGTVYEMSGAAKLGVTEVLRALRSEIDDNRLRQGPKTKSPSRGNPEHARRIVIKIGSALLVDRAVAICAPGCAALADDVAWLRGRGRRDPGLVGVDRAWARGAWPARWPTLTLEQSQAAAAVGQIELARAYAEALAGAWVARRAGAGHAGGQRRQAPLPQFPRHAGAAFELGAVPIVNENDTVATDEIRYGDNDRMAAQVAVTAGADQLILLSGCGRVLHRQPRTGPRRARLDVIEAITPEIEAMAGDAGTGLSKGGMKTKLMAAKTATAAGCDMAITEGSVLHPVRALEGGAPATWFRPKATRSKSARRGSRR